MLARFDFGLKQSAVISAGVELVEHGMDRFSGVVASNNVTPASDTITTSSLPASTYKRLRALGSLVI